MEHVQLGWINWSTEFSWSAITSKQEEKSENAASLDTKQVPKTIAAIWIIVKKPPEGTRLDDRAMNSRNWSKFEYVYFL